MATPQLKPIEERDPYAAMVLAAFDSMETPDNREQPPTIEEMAEALRKAVAWGEAASNHILYREKINWRYLEEARGTLECYFRHNVKSGYSDNHYAVRVGSEIAQQICGLCDAQTGRRKEDSLYAEIEDGDLGPVCEKCYELSQEPSESQREVAESSDEEK